MVFYHKLRRDPIAEHEDKRRYVFLVPMRLAGASQVPTLEKKQ